MAKSCCGGSSAAVRNANKTPCCGGASGGAEKSACAEVSGGDSSSSCGTVLESSGDSCADKRRLSGEWVIGTIVTPAGLVPQIATKLTFKDKLGSWKCRWSIGRMNYKVEPGLYAVGTPDENAPVLVTANYKMTFDRLREKLGGLNLWIVVLDTDGINVWCAAGKGTFGTEELANRIGRTRLGLVVKHRNLILPELGAVGVAAHEVRRRTGFGVIYGTVRASDIKEFLANGMKATEEMRTVKFTIRDRLVLTPLELVGSFKPLLIAFGFVFIWNAVGIGHYGAVDLIGILGAVLTGAVITPALLPWVPGRAFSFKGGLLGLVWAAAFLAVFGMPYIPGFGWLKAAAYLLLLPSVSAYLTMNFTGSSTYTSLSGVDREMKYAVPIMLFAAAGALILLIAGDFIRLFGGMTI